MNPWLNYSPPLHRAREIGAHHRIFDVLDERLLTYDEIFEFMSLMFGWNGGPDPRTDWQVRRRET